MRRAARLWSRRSDVTDGGTSDARKPMRGALIDGTMVATDAGWRPVETLRPGARVLTYDQGFRAVVDVERRTFWSTKGFDEGGWPLRIAPDVVGNVTPLVLLPEQLVLCDGVDDDEAGPVDLAPASLLRDREGVTAIAPGRELSLTRLIFDAPHLICVNYGAVVQCLDAVSAAEPGAGREGDDSGASDVAQAARAARVIPMAETRERYARPVLV